MNSTYLNKYTIVQTFKESDSQKVFIGTDNTNGQAVVINTISIEGNDSIWDSVEQDYKNIFNHILHFERIENQMIFVTKVEEGLSLNAYLKDLFPNFTERVNLIYQYLYSIKQYDLLPNNIKSILVDESQIIINKGRLFFDELIIFDKDSFESKDFESVINNIILVLKKLTSLPSINYDELPLYIKTMEFLDELKKNKGLYNNINEIFNNLEKLNIGNLSIVGTQDDILNTVQNIINSDTTNLVGRKVGSIDEEAIKVADLNKKRIFTIAISTAGVITVALVGLLVFKSILPIDTSMILGANIASTKIVDANDLYKDIDSENAFTENSDEKIVGPNNNIDYISEHITQDFTTSKYGTYSFKISGDDSTSHKLSINQGHIKANSKLLMWIKLDTDDEIKMTIEGYSKDKLSFQKSISHMPLYRNNWDLVQLTFNTDIDDHIEIIFNDISGTVWIDKISVDIFK